MKPRAMWIDMQSKSHILFLFSVSMEQDSFVVQGEIYTELFFSFGSQPHSVSYSAF